MTFELFVGYIGVFVLLVVILTLFLSGCILICILQNVLQNYIVGTMGGWKVFDEFRTWYRNKEK